MMMRGQRTVVLVAAGALLLAAWVVCWSSDAEMYFAADKNGEERVTEIREGSEVWLAVYDPDEDSDCDVRDKVWTEIKVVDAKTGAYIVWDSRPAGGAVAVRPPYHGHWPGNTAGSLTNDYLEETGASTGVFTSSRPFQFGSRVSFASDPRLHAHIVGPYQRLPLGVTPTDFQWGGYLYAEADGNGFGDDRVWVTPNAAGPIAFYNLVNATIPVSHTPNTLPPLFGAVAFLPGEVVGAALGVDYTLGRFENLDTIMGLYEDQDDRSDIAITLAKINDTRSTLEWSRRVYRDGNESATITITDDDENLSCNAAEYVPVFVIVNPGTWNPLDAARQSATNFCMLKRWGGVINTGIPAAVGPMPMDWFNIYDSGLGSPGLLPPVNLAADGSNQPNAIGSYYIQYPNVNNIAVVPNVTTFDTASNSGVTRCMFYAQETGANTGVFELHINSLRVDLGFRSFREGDTLAAYYVDPNDQDDFSLGTASLFQEMCNSLTTFTDENRVPREELWIGRDSIYVEVQDENANRDTCCPEEVLVHICDPHEVDDSEWLIVFETSNDSPTFFSQRGILLASVWDALGVGMALAHGGYQLRLDNWRLEGFNEDVIYARYNDVTYTPAAMAGVGDMNTVGLAGQFPPAIQAVRSEQDVSFDVIAIADTQVVVDGVADMYFLDAGGNRVEHYVNSSAVYVEVVDPDQDEDQNRRERIDGYWDKRVGGNESGQNIPFAPVNAAPGAYPTTPAPLTHPVNDLLGFNEMFDGVPPPGVLAVPPATANPKLYVVNPRSGLWGAFDLLETEIDSGVFRSTICIDLVSQYAAVPTLGVLPGDTIFAFYQDPSNHSDNAWISIKVSCGGSGVAPGTGSSVAFIDADGNEVSTITDVDPVHVRVVDPSHVSATRLPDALTIGEQTFEIMVDPQGPAGTFYARNLVLDLTPGQTLVATYVDPSDPLDQASDSVQVTSSVFSLERFVVTPNPFADEVTFTFDGTGIPSTFTVTIYDLTRRQLWSAEGQYVTELEWNGRNADGEPVGKGAYVYVVTASDEETSYTEKDVVVKY